MLSKTLLCVSTEVDTVPVEAGPPVGEDWVQHGSVSVKQWLSIPVQHDPVIHKLPEREGTGWDAKQTHSCIKLKQLGTRS